MIAIVKYNAGNTTSVKNALVSLGVDCIVTDDVNIIQSADKVIFPGVGEAGTAMQYLKEKGLDFVIRNLKQPVLGICLGLQLMCKHSEEGDTNCIGIFDVEAKKFPPKDIVPHMGWNNLLLRRNTLFNNITATDDVYFVHSYYAELNENCIAECDYINPFAAAIQKDNFYAVQFHPEKSGKVGLQILQNFIEL